MDILQDFVVETAETKILLNLFFGLLSGVLISLGYAYAQKHKSFSKHFAITILLLPVVVVVVIPLIATDLKKAVSLAGIFTLVRFRSVPGDSKDILYIFFSLTIGVALSLSYYAASFTLLILFSFVFIFLERKLDFTKEQLLKITIPEDMNFSGLFDEIFEKYLLKANLKDIKTSNMGSLFTISYSVLLKNQNDTKKMIDELRTKNGNLNIVLQMDPESISKL